MRISVIKLPFLFSVTLLCATPVLAMQSLDSAKLFLYSKVHALFGKVNEMHLGNYNANRLDEMPTETTSDCTGNGSNAVCVVAESEGILKVSNDAGNTWSIKPVPQLPLDTRFVSISCTGSGPTAVCVAIGFSRQQQEPLLVASSNGGATWELKSIAGLPEKLKESPFSTISCTGEGASAICVAGGWFGLLAVSNDAAKNWTFKSLPDSDDPEGSVMLTSVSCSGSSETPVCAATGGMILGFSVFTSPIYISVDKGNTWEAKTSPGFPTGYSGVFESISCTGDGPKAVCAAGGVNLNRDGLANGLFLAVSSNGGNDWVKKIAPGIENNKGPISAISCTGNGASAICAASGWEPRKNEGSLAISIDGGENWSVKSVTKSPMDESNFALFKSLNCVGDSPTALCVAAGIGVPYSLMISKDGGNTWIGKTINGLSENVYFYLYAVSCTGSESTAICIANGHSFKDSDASSTQPILAISNDGGNNWALQTEVNKS